jgi:type I restriction enzyme S subunit
MSGSAAGNIRLPVLRNTPIWLPSLEMQRSVAAHLNEQIAKIDMMIAETERFIKLARERRTALIIAAVAGQIDIREVA